MAGSPEFMSAPEDPIAQPAAARNNPRQAVLGRDTGPPARDLA
jgi:hypothetical protein